MQKLRTPSRIETTEKTAGEQARICLAKRVTKPYTHTATILPYAHILEALIIMGMNCYLPRGDTATRQASIYHMQDRQPHI